MTHPRFAIILAGGRGSRLGGLDKPSLSVGGRRLIDVALSAVADAERVVVVGPTRELDSTILQARENPPGSGPAFAVAAGLAALDGDTPACQGEVAVLAADIPFLTPQAVDELSRARDAADSPAAFALDSAGRIQYLVGVWDLRALRESLSATTGPAMRRLVPTESIRVSLADDAVADVDTAADLRLARRRVAAPPPRLEPPQALAALRTALAPLAVSRIAIDEALGTALAAGLRARQPFPAFDAAAMDGYAVAGPGPWRVSDVSVAAGAAARVTLPAGHAVRIATGAMLPVGADRVIRDEELRVDDETVVATSSPDRDDTRRRGSEWAAGDELIAAGTRVDDAVVSVARSAGVDEIDARGPVRVVVYPTGDEIAEDTARLGTIRDTASGAVGNVLRRTGCRASSGARLADDRAGFTAAIEHADADVVVLIGATGRGVADHLRGALADVGADIVVDGVDLRPGGSLLVATVAAGPVVVGLGGNPLAAVAGVTLLIGTLTQALLGALSSRPELIQVDDLATAARASGWRIMPVTPAGGRWSTPRRVPTAHLAALIGASGFALVPPGAQDTDLVELLR